MRPEVRLLLAAAAVAAWLLLLFTGYPFGGLTHLLLVAALVAFPWRVARERVDPPPAGGAEDDPRP